MLPPSQLENWSVRIVKLMKHCKFKVLLHTNFFTGSMLQKEREAFKKEKEGKKFGHALLVRLQGKYNFKGRNMCLSADVKVA